jgi:hypothetical protein
LIDLDALKEAYKLVAKNYDLMVEILNDEAKKEDPDMVVVNAAKQAVMSCNACLNTIYKKMIEVMNKK